MKPLAITSALFLLSCVQWDQLNWLYAKIGCHWYHGPAMCRDWHRR